MCKNLLTSLFPESLFSCLSGLVGAVFGQISMQEGAHQASSPSCRHVVPLNLDIAPAAAVRAARRTPDKGARPRYGPRASPCAPALAPVDPARPCSSSCWPVAELAANQAAGRAPALLPIAPVLPLCRHRPFPASVLELGATRAPGYTAAPTAPPPPPSNPPQHWPPWPASPPWRSLPPSSPQPPCSSQVYTIQPCWHTRSPFLQSMTSRIQRVVQTRNFHTACFQLSCADL